MLGHMQKVNHFGAQIKDTKRQLGRFCPEPFNWKLFSKKYEMNSFSFPYIMKYGVGIECTYKFKNRLHIIILMLVID